jgi:hypothetical protein
MNYETPKTDSGEEILELTLDEQHYVAGGFHPIKIIEIDSWSFGASNAAPGTKGSRPR